MTEDVPELRLERDPSRVYAGFRDPALPIRATVSHIGRIGRGQTHPHAPPWIVIS